MAYGFNNDRSKVEMYTAADLDDIIPVSAFSSANTVKDYIDNSRNNGYPNCVLLGDSWTDINSATVIDGVNWTTRLPYWTFHNYAKGGAGFLISGNTFETQATNAANDTSYNHNDVTHCLIVCGVNDFRNGSTNTSYYTTPIRTVCGILHTAFPNAQIILIFASTERPYLGAETPATWIDSWRVWNILKRWCDNILPGYSIGPIETHVITYLFPDSAFITWGDSNYQRHLSKLGHRQLATAIERIVRTGKAPALMMNISSSLPSGNASLSVDRLCGVLTNEGFKFTGRINVAADISNSSIYVDLSPTNDSHFDTNPAEGIFCATFTDVFPKRHDETVASYSSYKIANIARTRAAIGMPLWGSTVSDSTAFPILSVGLLPYYANNPIRLRFDVKNIVDGMYTFNFEVPFLLETEDSLLLRIGTYDIEDL